MRFTRQAALLTLPCIIALQGVLASAARSSGYDVVFERSYHPTSGGYGNVHSLVRTRDGGYAFSGRSLFSQAWVVKTNSNGGKEWEAYISGSFRSEQDAHVVIVVPDGGLLLGGKSNSHDLVPGNWGRDGRQDWPYAYRKTPTVAFIARFDRSGRLVWRKAYGRLGNVRSSADFSCGKVVDDGFVMVGTRFIEVPVPATMVPYYPYLKVLWVVKLSRNGDIVWQKLVKQDGDDLLSPTIEVYCTTPITDSAGRVTFAATLQKRTPGGPYVKYPHHLALVISFNRKGEEVARRRIDDAVNVQLRATANGFVVLDNPPHAAPGGIRRTELDRKLGVISQSETKFKDFMFWLAGASPLGEEGFYIAGRYVVPPHERGKPAVATLDGKGRLENLKTFGLLFSDWGEVRAISPGDNEDEIVLLRQGGTSESAGLVKLKVHR